LPQRIETQGRGYLFHLYASVGLALVAKGTLGGLYLILRFNGGWRFRFVRFPVSPTPNPSNDGFLGPEVPRTLGRGTPHAKLEKIKELHEVGFKPKE
jgi:hypothetical protein